MTAAALPSQAALAPNWFLAFVPRRYWRCRKSFYVYEQDFLSLPSLITQNGNLRIQADSHFLCVGGAALVADSTAFTEVGGPLFANPYGIHVLIENGGIPLTDKPVPLDNLFGSGMQLCVWPIPVLWRAGSTVLTRAQSWWTASTMSVHLSFWGIRLYETPAR